MTWLDKLLRPFGVKVDKQKVHDTTIVVKLMRGDKTILTHRLVSRCIECGNSMSKDLDKVVTKLSNFNNGVYYKITCDKCNSFIIAPDLKKAFRTWNKYN